MAQLPPIRNAHVAVQILESDTPDAHNKWAAALVGTDLAPEGQDLDAWREQLVTDSSDMFLVAYRLQAETTTNIDAKYIDRNLRDLQSLLGERTESGHNKTVDTQLDAELTALATDVILELKADRLQDTFRHIHGELMSATSRFGSTPRIGAKDSALIVKTVSGLIGTPKARLETHEAVRALDDAVLEQFESAVRTIEPQINGVIEDHVSKLQPFIVEKKISEDHAEQISKRLEKLTTPRLLAEVCDVVLTAVATPARAEQINLLHAQGQENLAIEEIRAVVKSGSKAKRGLEQAVAVRIDAVHTFVALTDPSRSGIRDDEVNLLDAEIRTRSVTLVKESGALAKAYLAHEDFAAARNASMEID